MDTQLRINIWLVVDSDTVRLPGGYYSFAIEALPGDPLCSILPKIRDHSGPLLADARPYEIRLWKANIGNGCDPVRELEALKQGGQTPLRHSTQLQAVFLDGVDNGPYDILVDRIYCHLPAPSLRSPSSNYPARGLRGRWQASRLGQLPLIEEVPGYIEAPLAAEMKIPISSTTFDFLFASQSYGDQWSEDDLKLLFEINENSESPLSFIPFISALLTGITADDSTEASLHYFLDTNIRAILEDICPRGRSVRDSSRYTVTGKLRPDYGFIYRGVCLFRGEERLRSSTDDPRAELSSKLGWIFYPAPFIFGYYAKGTDITPVVIHPPYSGNNIPRVYDLLSKPLQLHLRRDRLRNICYLINIARFFGSISELAPPLGGEELIKIDRGRCTIEFAGWHIIKEYIGSGCQERFKHTGLIYESLKHKKVPNTDQLITASGNSCRMSIILYPRGKAITPRNVHQLLQAVTCVLMALVVLHQDPPIYHRDIRWSNVINDLSNPDRWFLIDWEHASEAPTQALHFRYRLGHSPTILVDGHGAEVDVWGVGELILRSKVPRLPVPLRELGEWMQEGCSSAALALHRVKIFMESSKS